VLSVSSYSHPHGRLPYLTYRRPQFPKHTLPYCTVQLKSPCKSHKSNLPSKLCFKIQARLSRRSRHLVKLVKCQKNVGETYYDRKVGCAPIEKQRSTPGIFFWLFDLHHFGSCCRTRKLGLYITSGSPIFLNIGSRQPIPLAPHHTQETSIRISNAQEKATKPAPKEHKL